MGFESLMNSFARMMAQNFFATAVMIPIVALLCGVFRYRPAVQNLLWVLVLVKFVTPPLPYLSWQLPDVVSHAVTMFAGAKGESVASSPLADDSLEVLALVAVNSADVVVPAENSRGSATRFRDMLPFVLSSAWLIGAVALVVIQAVRIRRRFALVCGGVAASDTLSELVNGIARRVGLRGLSTLIVQGIASPFLCCLGRIRLAWPVALAQAEESSVRAIVAHEAAHLRRGDHWVAWLELIASAIWWWNPLFWFARRQLHVTAEMSCDALALATFPEDRCVYAETLLWLSASLKTGAPPLVLAVSGGTPSSLERRMTVIVSERVSGKVSVWGWMLAGLLVVVAAPGWSVAQFADPSEEVRSIRKTKTAPAERVRFRDTGTAQSGEKVSEPKADLDSAQRLHALRLLIANLKAEADAEHPDPNRVRKLTEKLNGMVRSAGEPDTVSLWKDELGRSLSAQSEPTKVQTSAAPDSNQIRSIRRTKSIPKTQTSQPNVPTSAAISPDGKRLHVELEYSTDAQGRTETVPSPPTGAGISGDGKKLHVEYSTKAADAVDLTRGKQVSPNDGSTDDKRLFELIETVRKQSAELQELRDALKRIESRGEPRSRGTNRFEQPSGAGGQSSSTNDSGAGGGTSSSTKDSGTSSDTIPQQLKPNDDDDSWGDLSAVRFRLKRENK